MNHLLKYICLAFAITSFVGCSSTVTHPDRASSEPVEQLKVAGVKVVLSNEAKEKLKDNLKFNAKTLQTTVLRSLEGNDLIDANSGKTLEIEVTDIRVRSNFSAVMFGFMAGADTIAGDVTVKDSAQHTIDSYGISASYALGGLAGGQDNTRMDWLYEKFAELTTKEILGEGGS